MSLKRMTIALPEPSARALEILAELQDITQAEALRKAISTEAYVQNAIRNGSRLLLESPDKEIKEVIFR